MATVKNGRDVKAHQQYYDKKGERLVGVTTVLGELNKPALLYWANNIGLQGIEMRKYVDDKADIGTLIHEMVFAHLKNQECDTSNYTKNQIDLAENGYLKYLDWEKGHELKPILLETPLVSEAHRYGGKPDNYCVLDGILTLVDYKSGKGIYDDMFYQLAAYEWLLTENGHRVEDRMILRIGRDESEGFEVRKMENLTREFGVFLHALGIYQLKKAIKKG